MDGYVAWLRGVLVECHRVLRPTGSLFVHLDWRASHRARILLDELYGERCFRNEIIWHYGLGGGAPSDAFARKHDTILFYARSDASIFHAERGPVTPAMDAKYAHVDELGRRYQNAHGRRYYLLGGKRLDDVWAMPALAPTARERVGWPTQKPLALLERIVRATCDPGGARARSVLRLGDGARRCCTARRARRRRGSGPGRRRAGGQAPRLARRAAAGASDRTGDDPLRTGVALTDGAAYSRRDQVTIASIGRLT